MKKIILLTFPIILSAVIAVNAGTISVKADGTGDYPTIQDAINDSNAGDVIILQPGTYTGPGNRDIDFLGKAITVRSTDPNDPNVVAATIIYCNGTPSGGFYFHNSEDTNSILDGLTITNGRERRGAIHCSESSPLITNCIITSNKTVSGIYCEYSNATINNCTITANKTSGGGGGIYCEYSNATINNCTITANTAFFPGGGIYCVYSNVTINNCTINANIAYDGGGIGCYRCSPIIVNCSITGNYADVAGGIYCDHGSPVINNCIIKGNTGQRFGGGIFSRYSSPSITNCTITGNISWMVGGGIASIAGNPSIVNCVITGNSARTDGGGLAGCSGPITNCTITDNSSEGCGGGIYGETYGSTSPINNCTISRNSARWNGGGLFECRGPISNCLISGNSAGGYGGGIDLSPGPIRNCTIVGNRAEKAFGGVAGPYYKINNCIIWNNFAHRYPQLFNLINYSCIQAWPGWPDWFERDNTNINSDPCFVEPGYWADINDPNIIVEPNNQNAVWVEGDYRLLSSSPCIDTGEPNFIPEPNETDLDGHPRLLDGDEDGIPIVDMGAYEYRPPIPAEVNIEPHTLNLASKGKWITCHIRLPEDYSVTDIDPNSIYLEDVIKADELQVNDQLAIARFSRTDVQAILDVGNNVEVAITGELTDGTAFAGTDTIKVLDK